jgi:hypothetical protein
MTLDAESKVLIATEKKDAGDDAFKKGDLQDGELFTLRHAESMLMSSHPLALRNYHEV